MIGQTADLFEDFEDMEGAQEETKADSLIRYLQTWHRELSDQIIEANQAAARLALAGKGGSEEAINLRELVHSLQKKLLAIEDDLTKKQNSLSEQEHSSSKRTAALVGQNKKNLFQRQKGLLPQRYINRDFFLADLFDYTLKDDGASMEAPIFTLSTKPDLSIWTWESKDGNKKIKVSPSVEGRATQFDKDVLIYIVSQITEALNRGREDAINRTVRFTVYDFLVTTNRGVSGDDYKRLQGAFERLAGTRITTDIRTGGERIKEGFGIIDTWKIVEKSKDEERMIAVEVTLSKWLFNAVQAFEVLTIHPNYFRLRKPIARRLYELARKHCGHQATWKISLELLRDKAGSKSTLKEFRRMVKTIEDDDSLPEYRLNLGSDNKVTFYIRDIVRQVRGMTRQIASPQGRGG